METETKPSLNEGIAEEIRALLARRRLSASDLARMTGLTQRAISRRLTGEKVIDADDLERIAAVLGVDYRDLLPVRAGRLITVGGAPRPTPRGDLTTAHSPLAKRPGTHSPRGRVAPPLKGRTGRIDANLVAA
jgi:transcriptional regulator with XRE-family HTH domain